MGEGEERGDLSGRRAAVPTQAAGLGAGFGKVALLAFEGDVKPWGTNGGDNEHCAISGAYRGGCGFVQRCYKMRVRGSSMCCTLFIFHVELG